MEIKPACFSQDNFEAICNQLAKKERAFKNILDQYGYPPLWKRPASFETLVHIILEQQVSLASALAALKKLKEKVADINPAAILDLSDEELKACYFSRQKIGYTRHLATCIITGLLSLEGLQQYTNEEVARQLEQVKGVGKWTSDVFLMMCLQRADCFPIGDIALRNSMKKELDLPPEISHENLLALAENWRPYRTVAAFMLWHAYLSKRKA